MLCPFRDPAMMRTVATYSLVHGAWHGGWAWDLVRAELETRGHTVHAPDLPCEDVGATAEDYAALVPSADVVVGHSLGGYVIPHVAASTRVFLCALHGPRDDDSPMLECPTVLVDLLERETGIV